MQTIVATLSGLLVAFALAEARTSAASCHWIVSTVCFGVCHGQDNRITYTWESGSFVSVHEDPGLALCRMPDFSVVDPV